MTDWYSVAEHPDVQGMHAWLMLVEYDPATHVWHVRSLVGVGASTGSWPAMQVVVLVHTGAVWDVGLHGPCRYCDDSVQLPGTKHVRHTLSWAVVPVHVAASMYVPLGHAVHAVHTVFCVALHCDEKYWLAPLHCVRQLVHGPGPPTVLNVDGGHVLHWRSVVVLPGAVWYSPAMQTDWCMQA